MLDRTREYAPVGLVPLAWGFTAAAHLGYVGSHALFVAHVVIVGLLVAFGAVSWTEMDAGALRAWRGVIVAGVGVTLLGVASFRVPAVPGGVLRAATVVGWMLLPVRALAVTARRTPAPGLARVYLGAAMASVAGGAVTVVGLAAPLSAASGWLVLAGIGAVGVGQTASIAAAAWESSRPDSFSPGSGEHAI
ncbi:hypothetical protein PNQ29_09110 [Halobacterium salinarum]|uniref:Uncharacterized protein n=3 Tax=Halobacterium salinarum TaxID=2242 RepID=Q9HN52_HALSA|nr:MULTISPECIES: hypothetical protein [Halobacterium]AAG20369.1 hypothetical protein VNG_2248H [Halobacterium salinarum NRC-1]MBB6089706.1 hypothetical protein [Halobacterium salinarum]MCF2164456.1 hypothetical protein [Halobacterium salinarum]MCF2167243.1 hypothetical protein [Halobacterium salinarum]MCF2239060.1 hypothetical protein [Halobacterium salinarum]